MVSSHNDTSIEDQRWFRGQNPVRLRVEIRVAKFRQTDDTLGLIFNGCIDVKNDDDTITIKQKLQGKKLALIDVADHTIRITEYSPHTLHARTFSFSSRSLAIIL